MIFAEWMFLIGFLAGTFIVGLKWLNLSRFGSMYGVVPGILWWAGFMVCWWVCLTVTLVYPELVIYSAFLWWLSLWVWGMMILTIIECVLVFVNWFRSREASRGAYMGKNGGT